MQKKKLSIAIPASVVSDTPHLREKTSKIGLVGRAVAIFRVDEIVYCIKVVNHPVAYPFKSPNRRVQNISPSRFLALFLFEVSIVRL